jgi:hypothetical protein
MDAPKKPLHEQAVSPATLEPINVIRLYDDTTWEQFVLEWLEGAQPKYPWFDRFGGAGDKGRDIVAYTTEQGTPGPIDLFQCKHYDHPLTPGDVWVEFGKLCVYTWEKAYAVPRKYRFVAPCGVGTTLKDLLNDPERLRAELIAKWDQHCRKGISSKEEYPLEGELLAHVKAFDFKIVGYEPPLAVLEQHSRTKYWHQRFKRDLPARPVPGGPPAQLEQREMPYVTELLDAYGEHLGQAAPTLDGLVGHGELKSHFSRARIDFFNADGLNRFYRDQFQEGAFDDVKKQILDGVVDTAERDHANGYQRVLATTDQAVQVQLTQNDYTPYVAPGDRKGICHHLVNDDKLKWIRRRP